MIDGCIPPSLPTCSLSESEILDFLAVPLILLLILRNRLISQSLELVKLLNTPNAEAMFHQTCSVERYSSEMVVGIKGSVGK